jgi:hypothetical protein
MSETKQTTAQGILFGAHGAIDSQQCEGITAIKQMAGNAILLSVANHISGNDLLCGAPVSNNTVAYAIKAGVVA